MYEFYGLFIDGPWRQALVFSSLEDLAAHIDEPELDVSAEDLLTVI